MPSGYPEFEEGRLGMVQAALFAACPKCGARTLFAGGDVQGIAQLAQSCRACGLDFTRYETSGRAGLLVTVIIAVILVCLAWWVDEAFRPPLWVHAFVWVPLTIAAVIGGLRFMRAAMVHARYASNRAEAGQ